MAHTSEHTIIAEYLRDEFHNCEYHRDRARYERIALFPDLNDLRENAIRKWLLFRRRRFIWQELPTDIRWLRVELESSDLPLTRIFPRGELFRVMRRQLTLPEYVSRIREGSFPDTSSEISYILALSYRLRFMTSRGAVLLIGRDHSGPFTILDGNHRLIAAMLDCGEEALQQFRFFFAESRRIQECIWYSSTLRNLLRYVLHRLTPSYYREVDIPARDSIMVRRSCDETNAGLQPCAEAAGHITTRDRVRSQHLQDML